METLSQSVSSVAEVFENTAAKSKPAIANIIIVIDNFIDNCISWCANHPKVAAAIGIFLFGFLLGILF